MPRTHRALLLALLAPVFLVACGEDGSDGRASADGTTAAAATQAGDVAAATTRRFDGERAFSLLRYQVSFGQRAAGSPELQRLAPQLAKRLPKGRLAAIPGHAGLQNVIGTLPGRRPAIVIGAHYDTEAQPPGFVGANDGAAGTAVVVELARTMRKLKRPARARELRFVLFDGEEEPLGQSDADFYAVALRGSKAYAKANGSSTRAMILLDYVGGIGQSIPREGTSNEALWKRLRAAAARAGVAEVFPDGTGAALYDDHTPFLRAGVPSIDLIDFDYAYKDTVQDTVDKTSARALDAVGETVVELLRALDRSGF
jgi:hypothetical protein